MIQYDQDKIIGFDDGISAWVDNDSGLMWEVKSKENIDFMYVWHKNKVADVAESCKSKLEPEIHDCTSYVERMNREKYAGFSNWRLPTIEELQSLINNNGKGRYIKDPLRYNSCPAYWSESPAFVVNVYSVPGMDWRNTAHIPAINIVDFVKPDSFGYNPGSTLWVRCVRTIN